MIFLFFMDLLKENEVWENSYIETWEEQETSVQKWRPEVVRVFAIVTYLDRNEIEFFLVI